MAPLALADVLTFSQAPAGGDTLHVEGHDPGPTSDNLVLRALAETRSGRSVPGGAARTVLVLDRSVHWPVPLPLSRRVSTSGSR